MPAKPLMFRIVLAALPAAAGAAALAAAAPPAAPSLWSVEVVDPSAPSSPTYVCADLRMTQSMAQALPEVDGQTCNLLEPPLRKGSHFEARCQAGDSLMVANSVTQGDPQRNFTVVTDISTRPSDPSKAEPRRQFTQTRRYVRTGACPAGWVVGDSVRAGDATVVNAVSGATRSLATPFAPPASR